MKKQQTIWLLALFLIPLIAFGLRLWGLNTSETWDEVAYYDAAANYYENVVEDRWAEAEAWEANREHPAISKWLYLIPSLDPISKGVSDFVPGRLLSASLGALTVLLTMLLARRLYNWPHNAKAMRGERVAIVAGATLALLPTVIGLNRVLGLDTPFTFFFVLSIWSFIEALSQASGIRHQASGIRHQASVLRIPAWAWHVLAILAFGLATGTRLTGVLLWPILAMIFIIVGSRQQAAGISSTRTLNSQFSILNSLASVWRRIKQPSTILWILAYLIIPPLVVVGTWPWLWSNTLEHWNVTWGHWSPVATFFLGVLQEPGPGYYLQYFLVSFPALFVILSILFWAKAIVRGNRSDWILMVWILVVLGFSLYGLRQGGFRYLIQLAPALAIGVAAYLVDLGSSIKNKQAVWLLPAIFVAYLIPHAVLHQPYQLDYYNEFSGGTKVVEDKKYFQVGWWGEGVNEAVEWVNANLPYDADISFTAVPDRAQRLLRKDFDHTIALPDYIITNPAFSWQLSEYPTLHRYHRVYAVTAHDAPIAEVWELVE